MPLFRRRRDEEDQAALDEDAAREDDAVLDGDAVAAEPAEGEDGPGFVEGSDELDADPPFSRADGPWDVSEAPETEIARLDLGGLRVPGYPGLELRIELDEETGNVVSVAGVVEDAGVQIQVFAAPRTQGVWREVRAELAEGIRAAGGTAEEVDGPFGRELRSRIPVESPQGKATQEARFVGVDGPRWFLRGVFSGKAYKAGAQPDLEGVFRGCVVVRGDTPMAPKDPLPLHLPDRIEGVEGLEETGERAPLEPFRRGPEITEIH